MRNSSRIYRWAWVGLLALATSGCSVGGGPGRAVPESYGLAMVNNTGSTIYSFGVDFGPQPIGEQLGDGVYRVFIDFPYEIPVVALVFWQAPKGFRHECWVPVLAQVPDTRAYVNLYFAIRADGQVDVVALTPAAAKADGAAALQAVRRRGRPADQPEPPPFQE